MNSTAQQHPFIVLGLPRSRTAWLARFLSYGDYICGHEQLRYMRSLDDVKAWFDQPCVGSAETAAASFWRLIPKLAPDARIVIVRRPVHEVFTSLSNLGLGLEGASLRKALRAMDRKLDQIEARLDNVLVVNFADLNSEVTCKAVFEHCLPYEFDRAHWEALAPVNVQCDMRAIVRYASAHQKPLQKLALCARHVIMADLAARPAPDADGMTLQAESFDDWLDGARKLFDDHLMVVGEAPGDWRFKNLPAMQRLYDAGALQIVTARCNGRMFGYLMTIISPSLTSPDVISAMNSTFYADPHLSGLGTKLQRASLDMLKRRGVHEVFFEAGQRGSGPKLGALYKRLGAQDHGQVYRLQLEA